MAWKWPERDDWPTDEKIKVVYWSGLGFRTDDKITLAALRLGKFIGGYWQLAGDPHWLVTPPEHIRLWMDLPALPDRIPALPPLPGEKGATDA